MKNLLTPWMPPRLTRSDWGKVALLLALVGLVSFLHFFTPVEHRYLHEVYQRLYYLPIVLAAFWYGPVFGLLAATTASLFYILHIRWHWSHAPVYSFNQYAEIVLYHVVALIIGALARRTQKQHEALEQRAAELREAYERLQETFERLRRADRLATLGALSAGMAHEIKNPLGSIRGAAEIVRDALPPDHPKREFLDIIRQETDRLNRFVEAFLRSARRPRAAVESHDLNTLIRSTATLLEHRARDRGVALEFRLDPTLPPLRLDPDQVRQLLLNLLLNALEALDQGGKITVRTEYVQEGGLVRCEVADTGPGVPDEELSKIFDPFYTTKGEGTGLGLAVARQCVENHGGSIRAFRNRQGGLSVAFTLPVE
ncbi:MAG: ATP-binding protein [Acidobacteriota bacterium]